ncbi:DUF3526 domain-containing protein [Tenacibaculum sp. 1_MG-2023]|uniref:DUF3526 domain-containing protein n=1 Tax=Tenacibaculum sp. 1_MG-2023 TaxID=3062653 RepID=UPI0026E2A400|nr:DUF3526 domain-containing protein [Tenacibaculum sp. 1_MG-2023]MDO6676708.1 DUF3526 domain-containing protein [Tenacibaculum sp. 1_MG-2023]
MIFSIVKKELQEILRDGRFKISTGIVFILLVVALVLTFNQYQHSNQQYVEAQKNERSLWEEQGEKNPHSAAHYGNYVFKPKSPLSLIDQGIEKYTGISIFLEAHNRNEAQFSNASDQTSLSRFGELSLSFILLYILPLILILIGYDSYTKELEKGTFAILKSQGISNTKLLFGKWFAVLIPIITITTLLFLIAGLILSNTNDVGVFSWSTLGVLYIAYLLYYLIFTNVILFISLVAKKSGVALVSSLVFWVLACFIAPKIASNLADSKYPYPTHQEFSKRIAEDRKKGLDGHNPWNEEAKKLEEEALKKYNVDSVHKLPFNYNAYRMQKGEEYQAKVYAKHYSWLDDQAQKQEKVYKSISIISPFLPTRFLSMAISRTDYQSHRDFSETAETYRVKTQEFLNGLTEKNSKYGERYIASANAWKKLPKFEYTNAPFYQVLNRNTFMMLILFMWFTITGVLVFFINKNH